MIDLIGATIVRIYTTQKKVVGAGFLVGKRHVLTCAHNVLNALGLTESQVEIPRQAIFVDFPMVAAGKLIKGSVNLWQPARNDGGDIAGLELETDPPVGAQLARLLETDDVQYHTFCTYGFPNGFDNGVTATGRLVGRQLVTSWVQIEDVKETGQRIQPGFSGAPVWDEQLGAIVGMIVAVDRQPVTKTAFMIPTDVLQAAWSILSESGPQIKKTSWKDGLSEEYLRIATEPAQTLRVLAGPGTGKTYSLVRRVAQLIENGADPRRILLVTFTRAAASDLAKGLRKLNVPRVAQIVSGTLHSFCFSVLRQANVFLQTGRASRRILLEFEVRFLLEDLKYGGKFGNFNARKKLLKSFEAAWAREQDQLPGWLTDPTDRQFDSALKAWLRFHDAMLIEEVIPETLKYLRDNPACPERSQFDHVLVDEYQDLNKAEQNLVDLLRGSGTLTVIGDEDQSIYERFRHAHPEGITTFDTLHPNTSTRTLSICRRCPSIVLEMAGNLIQFNSNRTARPLLPEPNSANGEVHIVQWQDMDSEAEGLARFINARIVSGVFKPGEILVLCPRKEFGWLIKSKLSEQYQLPVRSFFHEEEFKGNPKNEDGKAASAQQAFTLLLLAQNSNDKVALRCWLGFEQDDLGADQYKRLYDYCHSTGQSTRESLDALCEGRITIAKTNKLVDRYQALLTALEAFKNKTAREIFDELFPPGQDWTEPFRYFSENISEAATLESYVEAIRTGVTQPEMPSEADFIRVMSLHKSKGLTAEHVIVMGCVQGLIPTLDNNASPEEQRRALEEQRRLFYVATTRPKKTLVISSVLTLPRGLIRKMGAQVIGGNREVGNTVSSEFLSQLGSRCPAPVNGKRWQY